jgi:hypothetical protein
VSCLRLAAGERHDLVRAEPFAGATAQHLEPAAWPAAADLQQDDMAVLRLLEFNRIARLDAKAVPHRFGDGDLTLAGDHGGHACSFGNTWKLTGNTT